MFGSVVVPSFGAFLLKHLPQSARMVGFSLHICVVPVFLSFWVVGSRYTVGKFACVSLQMAEILIGSLMIGNCSDRLCVRVSRLWEFFYP